MSSKLPPMRFGRQAQSKISPVSLNPSIAQTPAPATQLGTGENRIQISTYFTRIPTNGQGADILYSADRQWTRLTLVLETAGPVAVGQLANLFPVLSGRGQLLATGVPVAFDVAKGNKLYIAAQSVNRIKVTVAPYPWLETITGLITAMAGGIAPAKKVG